MRQVPQYLIVGNGRMARHCQHYFQLLELSYLTWSRRENSKHELKQLCQRATHILLLISDDAIANFIQLHNCLATKILIHFSGSLVLDNCYAAHPLMTFNEQLYELEKYQAMPFIVSQQAPDFTHLLPGVPNQHYRIPDQDRAYYHALCVMSGNFTTTLWQKLLSELQQRWDIPPEAAYPYCQQITENLLSNWQQALTGPISRGDHKTIESNLTALKADAFHAVYRAMLGTKDEKY